MTPVIIGIVSGLLIIFFFMMLKQFDKKLMYGLILCGIGFLYVGYAWTDLQALIINALQAVFFTFFAYYGVKKSLLILAAGYFVHGIWDLVYHMFQDPGLIPPHYDLFCLSIDFTIGFYILLLHYKGHLNKRSNDSLGPFPLMLRLPLFFLVRPLSNRENK